MRRTILAGLAIPVIPAVFLAGCERKRGVRLPGRRAGPVTEPEEGVGSSRGPTVLRLLTYNVLADAISGSGRTSALTRVLGDSAADIMCFQEAGSQFVESLSRETWTKAYGSARPEGMEPGAIRGLYILSKHPIEEVAFRELPGRLGRGVLSARVRVGEELLTVATVHLESFPEDGPVRAAQLDAVFSLLRDSGDAILMGDFNFGESSEPETSRLDRDFVDLWTACRPGENGFTWDIVRNPMARRGSFPGEASGRKDRILLRAAAWRPVSIRIVGNEPARKGDPSLFPSDHFGLVATVEAKRSSGDGN